MEISKEEIKHIAELASLNLSEEEVEKMTLQMQDIIGFANTVNSLDTKNAEVANCGLDICNVFRKDEIKESMDKELLLQNAPETKDGMFVVPKTV